MKKTLIGLFGVVLMMAGVARAQAPQMPKPGPEMKRLAYFVGTWNSEMELKASPLGPAGKITAVERYQMSYGGFFLLAHSTFKTPMGTVKELAVFGYDTQAKVYTYNSFNNFGESEHFTGTIADKTWTWTSDMMMEGKMTRQKFTLEEVSRTSYTFRFDMQPEGGSWINVMEGKATKVVKAPAPKAQ
ncbi:MAG TPA: DUF1579 family protein [Blastocatellia bacterium]|nr:DUF1579 family protein [Blastocatellia bacterium]